jgi:hypothetical protein
MTRRDAFAALAALALFTPAGALDAQSPQPPFRATAQLGVPFMVGFQEVVIGTKEKVDTGTLRVLTISSARLAAIYPNKSENISAGAGEKLLILRGAIRNPSAVTLPVTGTHFLSIRFRDGKGKGEFKFAGIYDPETNTVVHQNLRKGQSAPFDCVIRIPAKFDPFRVGLYHQNRAKTAWYDFKPTLGKLNSTFSPDGFSLEDRARVTKEQSFDFDAYRMKVLGPSEPPAVGGVARGDEPLSVVSVEVTNAMKLPVR